MKHRPCGDCPWRKDAPPKYWHPDHFSSIERHCQHDGVRIMLCHKSTAAQQHVCAGWAAVVGFDAIGLRMAVMMGKYDPAGLDISGVELYASFDEMLAANDGGNDGMG